MKNVIKHNLRHLVYRVHKRRGDNPWIHHHFHLTTALQKARTICQEYKTDICYYFYY
jgi:hypothetical protein